MPHNQIPNNQDIMLDSNANLLQYENQDIMLDSNANLLQYEKHIRLMYRYAILALAGNVIVMY